MNPSSIQMLNLNTITAGDNPRLPTNLRLRELAENIGAVGLLEPVHVWYPGNGEIAELIRGHRRIAAINILADENPSVFVRQFPEGIPAIVWGGITEEEALMLKLDHGGQVTLSDPHELQMSATMMFNRGFTEAQVANHLKPLITRLSAMPAKAKAEIEELESALRAAKALNDDRAINKAELELADRIAKLYRGRVQHLHNVARCPDKVNAALYFAACGEKPKGFEDEALPKLTTDQVKALWKAHQLDLEITDPATGVPKFNKRITGPNFVAKWKALIDAQAKANEDGAEGTVREKAMSAKDMQAELKEGKWESVGFYKLTKRHSGDKSVEGLETLDREYRALDLVKQYDAALFTMVLESAEEIIKGLADEAAAGGSDADASDEGNND